MSEEQRKDKRFGRLYGRIYYSERKQLLHCLCDVPHFTHNYIEGAAQHADIPYDSPKSKCPHCGIHFWGFTKGGVKSNVQNLRSKQG